MFLLCAKDKPSGDIPPCKCVWVWLGLEIAERMVAPVRREDRSRNVFITKELSAGKATRDELRASAGALA